MFFFETIPATTWLMVAVVLLVLLALNEATRRNKYLSIGMYIVLPIILTIFIWPNTAGEGTTSGYWFAWFKTYSALVGVIGFMAIRHIKKLNGSKFMFIFPAAILSINIIEAIVRDFEVFMAYNQASGNYGVIENGLTMMGGPWNIINGIAGIINIITITGWLGIRIANTKTKDMVWPDMQWFWIIAYSFWNVSYCYNSISDRAFYAGLLIVITAIIASFIGKGAWLQHRAQTLALWAMFTLTFPAFADSSQFAIKSANDPLPMMILSILSITANVGVLVFAIHKKRTNKIKNHFKNDIYEGMNCYSAVLKANNLQVDSTEK